MMNSNQTTRKNVNVKKTNDGKKKLIENKQSDESEGFYFLISPPLFKTVIIECEKSRFSERNHP